MAVKTVLAGRTESYSKYNNMSDNMNSHDEGPFLCIIEQNGKNLGVWGL
jgi:hypothetical protein